MNSKKLDFVRGGIIELNDKFQKRELGNGDFYKFFSDNGFIVSRCTLVSLFPDGNGTYCGKVIRQDGRVFNFDMDINSGDDSFMEDITDDFLVIYRENRESKPWLIEVVSYDLFNEIIK